MKFLRHSDERRSCRPSIQSPMAAIKETANSATSMPIANRAKIPAPI